MGKDKIRRFQENESFSNLIQPTLEEVFRKDHPNKGNWHTTIFKNEFPIVLELGCGKGDYTLALARKNPHINYIGVDIKGARLWRGAKTALEEALPNVVFLRTRIEFIASLFGPSEVSEIWITFPDPQPLRENKRLTSERFVNRYLTFLKPNSLMHLKTDSLPLHEYTKELWGNWDGLALLHASPSIYSAQDNKGIPQEVLQVQTFYEQQFLAQGKPITYLQFQVSSPAIEKAAALANV